MPTLSYDTIPPDLKITEPYRMLLTAEDEILVCGAINQGIDAYLEAVFFQDYGVVEGKRHIEIEDSKSIRCLLRRLTEQDNDEAAELVSCILTTLGYEDA